MKKITSVLLSAIALIIMPGFIGMSTLIAQTWTFVDGGGSKGINTSTATYSRIPSTAQFNGLLYSAWEEQNSSIDQVFIKSYNGSSWTAAGESGLSKLNSSSTNARNPKIASYSGALYAAYEEYDASIYRIHVKKYNGTSWSLVEHYSSGDSRTTINIATTANATEVDLIVYNGYLYATWVEVPNSGVYNVRVSRFDGNLWTCVDGGGTYGLNYNTSKLAHTPRFAVYNSQLFLTWVEDGGSSTTYQVRVRRYDGSSTWTFVDGNASAGLNYNSSKRALTPVMASYNNCLYLFWSEPYYETYYGYGDIDLLRVRKYDGTSWSFVDGGGSTSGWNLNILDGAFNAECLVYNNLLYVTWDEPDDINFYGQIRCVQYDGATKTFLDGGGVTSTINYSTSADANEPIWANYLGDLYVMWQENNSGDQIRAKKTLLAPFIESVSVPANGTYIAGQTLTFTVTYSKDVVISGGTPYIPITLNTGGRVNATYTGGSGTSTLTFSYTIVAGNGDTDGISVGTTISNGGANLQSEDATPLTANLTINSVASTTGILVDAVGPTVTSVSSTTADGYYNAGDVITITITCSEAATVTGTPTLALNSGGTASYTSGSGTMSLTFSYTVASGQNSADLDYTTTSALSLSGGTIKDATGNDATLTLPTVGGSSSLGGQKNIVIDNTAPTVTITSTATNPTNASIPVTITFGESVTGFVVGDISVTNGTAGSFTTVNTYTYTASITPTAAGTVTVNVAGSVATDAAGNNNSAATALTRVYDNVAPTVTLSSTATDPTNASIPVTITFSESVTGFVVGDISITNGSAGSFSSVNAYTYTANITPTATGTVTVNVAGSVAADAAGNNNTAATALTRVYDNVAPTVTISSSATDPTNASSFPVTITFSESVTGFVVGDISVTNGTAGGFTTVNGYTYSVNITPSGQGVVNVNIAVSVATDAAGNANTAATQLSRTYDNIVPSVSVSSSAPDPLNFTPVPVNITFSEAVTGFNVSDITVGNGTASNLQTSDNISWTADISPTGMGAFSLEIYAGVAQDLAGNGNTASAYFQRTYDPKAPTVALSSTSSNPTKDNPIVVNIALSESSWNVLEISDIIVGNGTASNLQLLETGYHENWTVDIYPTADGLVTVDIPAGAVTDYAQNNNIAATQFSISCDITSPTLTITSPTSESTNASPIPVNITFSELVNDFVVGDITVFNGTAGDFSGSGTTYTLNITPSEQGLVIIGVESGVVTDAIGNENVATSLTRTYDTTAPTVSMVSSSSADGTYKTGDVIIITITFSEAVAVSGTPTLALNSGGTALYVSGSDSSILMFSYKVANGDSSAELDYSTTGSLSLSGGTMKDETGNEALLILPEVGSSNSLGGQKNILIGILPTVTTQNVSNISSTTASGNGNVTDLGYPNPIAYGVCWNTTSVPTISDSKADNGATSSTGSFFASITGLATGTTYYVRAYVTNVAGTSYGEEVSFTTDGIITYYLNGGINNAANVGTYIYGIGLTLNDPTRTGYTFGGWYDNEEYTGSAVTAISNTTKGDVTLYARWNSNTGINIANNTSITLYPNPAKDVVFIKGAKNIISIYDINSQLVLTKQIDDNSCINISSLANGVYLVKAENKIFKLIKE